MSVRRYPWKYKASASDELLMDQALSSQLYMVSEIGPTQFLIKGEDSPAKFKVTIGDEQTCSGCGGKRQTSNSKSPDLCVHIFFVMLKVLRLARSNNLVWQTSLLDTEITNILSQRYQRMEERAARRRIASGSAASAASIAAVAPGASPAAAASAMTAGKVGSVRVPKRDLDPDDVCPICQDELIDPVSEAGIALRSAALGSPPLLNLVHCQWSCGQQLHAKCMRVWAEHQIASAGTGEKKLLCPMCRAGWSGTASADKEPQQTNEQILRELKIQEHAAITPVEQPSTAVVVRTSAGRSTAATASSSAAPTSSSSCAAVKCCSCRKLLLLSEGRFMRCVHCVDEDNLCRVCFIRSKGIVGGGSSSMPTPLIANRANHVHCFVEAKPSAHPAIATSSASSDIASAAAAAEFPYAYGIDWLPAPVKAPPLSSQLAQILQSRQLIHADYDLLLALDESVRNHGRPMMHAYLTRTLAMPSMRQVGISCILCEATISPSQPIRVLPCFHQVHESCCQSQLMYDLLLKRL